MKNILDLRFIIGLFFAIVGIILLIGAEMMQPGIGKTETTNFWSGIVYVIFGLFLLILWFSNKRDVCSI